MRVFVTGITGTLGTALALLHHGRGDQVWGCARNESNVCKWNDRHPRVATLFVDDAGEINDPATDQHRALKGCDVCYHCAALKHVDLCETNQLSAWYQNVALTGEVTAACETLGVRLVFSGSDKACLPQGVYGATKLAAERIVTSRGGTAVRLGNLIGSAGSVFQHWAAAVAARRPVRVTDPDMTRYYLPVTAAAEFIAHPDLPPGRVVIPQPMRAARTGTLAAAVAGKGKVEITGARPGESTHQWLVAPGDRVRDYDDGRLILEPDGRLLPDGMRSDRAEEWNTEELLALAGGTDRD